MDGHARRTLDPDPLPLWEAELRALVVEDLTPERVSALTAAALGTSIATVAASAAAQGGTIMSTSAAIGASATSSTAAKVAAGCVAATLAAGGTMAATGTLPDAAQEFSADAAAHIGINLPRPSAKAAVSGSVDASAGTVVEVDGAGRVGVTVEKDRLVLTGIESEGAFTAHVVSQTDDTLIVEFRSAAETATLLVAKVGGSIASSVTTQVHASVGAGASGQAEGQAGSGKGSAEAEAGASAEGSTGTGDCGCDGEAEAEAEADVSIRIRLGG